MTVYTGLSVEDMQKKAAQIVRAVIHQEVSLSNTSASEAVPGGAIGAMLYCANSDYYWDLNKDAVAGDGGGAFATAGTWFTIPLHPDVATVRAILASGTATLIINFLFG